jgi:hypothetical protein
MFQAQFVVIREAIEVVLRHLGGLPCSDTTELFRTRVQDFAQETGLFRRICGRAIGVSGTRSGVRAAPRA